MVNDAGKWPGLMYLIFLLSITLYLPHQYAITVYIMKA